MATTRMENQLEEKMENQMETGEYIVVILGSYLNGMNLAPPRSRTCYKSRQWYDMWGHTVVRFSLSAKKVAKL